MRFVHELRKVEDKRWVENYARIPLIPVVFYSGHNWKEFYGPIQELQTAESCIVLTSGVEQLVQEVLYILVSHKIGAKPVRAELGPVKAVFPR